MSIFDFVRNAGGALGTKVYDLTHKDENLDEITTVSPERLNVLRKAHIERSVAELEIETKDFSADVDGEKVTLTGEVPSQEACEKITLVAGNQHGIAQVDCQLVVAEAAESKPKESKFYTVKAGDTLGKIAKEHLGSASSYMKIFEANQPLLSDPNKIYVGQTLRIPE